MKREVVVIGGGAAGMQTALRLAERGIRATIVEKESELGGKLKGWHRLFPSFTPAEELLAELRRRVEAARIEVLASAEVVSLAPGRVVLAGGETIECRAIALCSGFDLFDARIKEEYGYGIYDNVFTSADIERMFNEGRVTMADGRRPRRIALLHCVGSRDEKVCQSHCSRVCCITGVKQAMELRQLFPEADLFNFYMDIRMFGPGYEEMYRQAQQRDNIHFVRGRISEASPTIDGRLQIKAEDTLTGRPLRMSVDMLVLLVGMRAGGSNAAFAASAGVRRAASGFLEPEDLFLNSARSGVEGIFYAGTVTAPKNVGETLNEANVAADAIEAYLKNGR
ncbi:MAG: FAD-dependent oxidoreductase [Alistipes sp.]|nr:FAD-dependent oxidoreductase [Alistipes sp.]